jgi:hypothetical protein
LDAAADSLRAVLQTKVPQRGFDFSLDYEVRNELGLTLFDLAQRAETRGTESNWRELLDDAKHQFEEVLAIDSEHAAAHANLAAIYAWLGDSDQEAYHRARHSKYKMDDSAAEIAIPVARRQYPAANHAAEALVIYDLSGASNESSP